MNALRESVQAVVNVMKGGRALAIEETPIREIDEIVGTHSRFWPL